MGARQDPATPGDRIAGQKHLRPGQDRRHDLPRRPGGYLSQIVAGHQSTGSLGIKDDLVNAGATWVDQAAFRDGNIVWGRVVEDIPAFNRELVAALAA